MSEEMKAAALAYAEAGYAVLPVCGPVLHRACTCDESARNEYREAHRSEPGTHVECVLGGLCTAPGKHPLSANGHKDATADTATVEAWWEEWPDANIGLLVGEQFDVLDADRAIPEAVIAAWPAREVPSEESGRGGHYYFRPQPPGLRPPAKLSFGEWKSSGYIVAAPSLHRSGSRYGSLTGLLELGPAALTKGLRQALIREKFDPKKARRGEDAPALLERALSTLRSGEYPLEEIDDGVYCARCPSHAPMSDPQPHSRTTLGLRLSDDRLLIHCHAGCSYKDLRAALGIGDPLWAGYDREQYVANIPDAEAVIGGILDDIVGVLRRYLVVPHEGYFHVLALWIAHTWIYERFDVTPRVNVQSPVKRSGKTRVVELWLPLVRGGQQMVAPSAASIYRLMEGRRITLLFDDIDSWWGASGGDSQTLQSVMLTGYKSGAAVPRSDRDPDGQYRTVMFPTFAPLAYNGIHTDLLPDTLLDRSITLLMQRKGDQEVQRFRRRKYEREVDRLAARLEAWAQRHGEEIGDAYEHSEGLFDVPAKGNDRAVEIWEPLRAIAVAAGGRWPEWCDNAAVLTLSEAERYSGGAEPEGLVLLAHVREVFRGHGDPAELEVTVVRNALIDEAEWPWAEYGRSGSPITYRRVAMLLAPYKVQSYRRRLREGDQGFESGKKKWTPRTWLGREIEAAAALYVQDQEGGTEGDKGGVFREGLVALEDPGHPGHSGPGSHPGGTRGHDSREPESGDPNRRGRSTAQDPSDLGDPGPEGRKGDYAHPSPEDRILAAVAEGGVLTESAIHRAVGVGRKRCRAAIDRLLESGELAATDDGLVLGEAL